MASRSESLECPATKKKKYRGSYCAVAECNSSSLDGIPMHRFPKESEKKSDSEEEKNNRRRRQNWIKFVTTCRADFGKGHGTPNTNSRICSLHFSPDCYPDSRFLNMQFGMKPKNDLKSTAVPTIQKPHGRRPLCMEHTTTTTSTRAVSSMSVTSTCTTTTSSCLSSPVCTPSVSVLQGVQKIRGAYLKRELRRTLLQAVEYPTQEAPLFDYNCDLNSSSSPEVSLSLSVATQTDEAEVTNITMTNTYTQTTVTGKSIEQKTTKNKGVQACLAISCKGVQCDLDMKEAPTLRTVTTQCDLDLDTSYVPLFVPQPHSPSAYSEIPLDNEPPTDHAEDTDYVPEDEDPSADELESDVHFSSSRNLLVFGDQLMQLFRVCRRCAQPAACHVYSVKGSLVQVQQDCPHCQNSWTWDSQPFVRDVPAGNLIMSAAILFSGSIPSKALTFLKHMGVAAISDYTFFAHQRALLQPAVQAEWTSWQAKYVHTVKESGQELTLGGDGRADSPGHCAKYGAYTLFDVDFMLIADSNEVGNSQRMEKEGLQRCFNFLQSQGLTIREIVTDRHPMIIKWLRENQKGTKHSIDIWHVAKGLKKRLLKLALEKDCQALSKWIKSIINHLYWVAASTPQADGELMLQKWMSLSNHLHNKHTHTYSKYPACLHPPYPRRENGRKKKWLTEGSKLSTRLLAILNSRQMMRDIPMLSTGPQTATIESFHSVLNHFAPKMIGFSYNGMLSRSMLAALDFNENNNREQARNKEGELRYNVMFRKAKKGYNLQEVKVRRTHVYVERLLERVMQSATKTSIRGNLQGQELQAAPPPPLCSDFDKPNKEEMIQTLKSRYKK